MPYPMKKKEKQMGNITETDHFEELIDIEESNDIWYLKPLPKAYTHHNESRRQYKTDARRLKFCESCKMVWEVGNVCGVCYRHEDFPTIGLPRETCKYCNKNKEEE